MTDEEIIKKRLKKLKEKYPEADIDRIEKELIPLESEEVHPKVVKKKKK